MLEVLKSNLNNIKSNYLVFSLKHFLFEQLNYSKLLGTTLACWGFVSLFTSLLILFNFLQNTDSIFSKGSFITLTIFSLLYALWSQLPKSKYSIVMTNYSTVIELTVGDYFSIKNTNMIIPSNTCFETSLEKHPQTASQIINPTSLQGQFQQKYFNSNVKELNQSLCAALTSETPTGESPPSFSSVKQVYSIGTIAPVPIPESENIAYFLAMASFNNYGNTSCTQADLENSLTGLWHSLYEKGDVSPIIIPVYGMKRGRNHSITYTAMIQMIIESLITSCRLEKRCVQKLSIVIHPSDIKNNGINFHELVNFLTTVANYENYLGNKNNNLTNSPTGTPIS